jgi:hypothetical protein
MTTRPKTLIRLSCPAIMRSSSTQYCLASAVPAIQWFWFLPGHTFLGWLGRRRLHRVTQPPENGKTWPTKKSLSSPTGSKASAVDQGRAGGALWGDNLFLYSCPNR